MSHSILITLRSATLTLVLFTRKSERYSRGKELGTTTKFGKTIPQYLTSVLLSPGNTVFYALPWSRLSTSKMQTITNDQTQTFKIRKQITMPFYST
jgi:hypothetical protein